MGTLNYTLGLYGGDTARSVMGTTRIQSDAFTTSTSASFVDDGTTDITARAGEVFRCTISEAAWIAFGGRTATVGNDFYMRADTEYEWEISPGDAGKISVIDVA